MKNTFWTRHFLMCDRMAKKMLIGFEIENFAKLIIEEANGVIANEQMTAFFWIANDFLCELHESDNDLTSSLEENMSNFEYLAQFSKKELNHYYYAYCVGKVMTV